MFNIIYKITSPTVVEEFIDVVDINENKVLVKVDTMAICKADIRYYLGKRDKSILNQKYPLTPIHEAVGVVLKDPTNKFKRGDKVILVPNSINEELCKNCPHTRCTRNDLGNNYCPHALFRSSSSDGFMRQFIACSNNEIVKYDSKIPAEVAVFSELLSVGVAALRRINFNEVSSVALFGDGIMAYIVYLVLVVNHPNVKVTVFGKNENKLKEFEKATTTTYENYHGEKFDTLIECVGGTYSEDAINEMISLSLVGADLILMGVNELNSAINTRSILEKGLSLKGVTRSSTEDFVTVSKMLNNDYLRSQLEKMVISKTTINSINDIYNVFDLEVENRTIIGKNLLKY